MAFSGTEETIEFPSIKSRQKLYLAFQDCKPTGDLSGKSVKPPRRETTPPSKTPAAGVVDSLYERLEGLNKEIGGFRTQKLKPAVLKGQLAYYTGMLDSTLKTAQGIDATLVKGGAHTKTDVTNWIPELKNKLNEGRNEQVRRSLEQLLEDGKLAKAKAFELETEKQQLDFKKAAQPERTKLYKTACEKLADLTREIADWEGQIKEVGVWLDQSASAFTLAVATLRTAANDIEAVVKGCLPEVTSTPGKKPKGKESDKPAKTIADPRAALEACGSSWVNAKHEYGATPDLMQILADYRKEVVDDWLLKNFAEWDVHRGAGKGWVSVGSTDPTSDYDISVNKHGRTEKGVVRYDYELVNDFNKWFRGKFKAEPGTVFDTNLYASAPKMVTDTDPGAPSTNDVAALMKMRRYMSGGEFEAFRVETLAACKGDADQTALVEKQFEAADANFLVVIKATIEGAKQPLEVEIARLGKIVQEKTVPEETLKETEEKLKELTSLKKRVESAFSGETGGALIDVQDELEKLVHEVEHELKDGNLKTTNELYVNKIGEMRFQEEAYLILKEVEKLVAGELPPETDTTARGKLVAGIGELNKRFKALEQKAAEQGFTPEKGFSLKSELLEEGAAGDLVKLKAKLGLEIGAARGNIDSSEAVAKYFANEAYQSAGPFQHIVEATQTAAAKAEADYLNGRKKEDVVKEKAIALANVSADDFGKLSEALQKDWIEKAGAAIDDELGAKVYNEMEVEKAKLPPDQLLQSFNEQLGDFLKDLEHYGTDDPGKAFVQSSKYLDRLLDAARLMENKKMFEGSNIAGEVSEQVALQKTVAKDLVGGLRKAKSWMIPNPPKEGETAPDPNDPKYQEEQRRAFACKVMADKFKVNSVAQLGQTYVKLGVKVNAVARGWLKDHPGG